MLIVLFCYVLLIFVVLSGNCVSRTQQCPTGFVRQDLGKSSHESGC